MYTILDMFIYTMVVKYDKSLPVVCSTYTTNRQWCIVSKLKDILYILQFSSSVHHFIWSLYWDLDVYIVPCSKDVGRVVFLSKCCQHNLLSCFWFMSKSLYLWIILYSNLGHKSFTMHGHFIFLLQHACISLSLFWIPIIMRLCDIAIPMFSVISYSNLHYTCLYSINSIKGYFMCSYEMSSTFSSLSVSNGC